MVFTIVIGLLFLAIVFFHYLQGFFSATISAIIAVISAVLAFSLHEWVVERFLQGKVANTGHAMVLVALFAGLYLGLRILFDKAIPEGVSLPAALDRVGGAIMGSVAAIFALGILSIAAQELPFGAGVGGYTKYETIDHGTTVQLIGSLQVRQGTSTNELASDKAGVFDESARKRLFPVVIPGVDDILVDTVEHLSSSGSLAGSQALTDIHPNFLQEIYGQRAGIQAGTKHVQMAIQPGASDVPVTVEGVYTVSDPVVAVVDAYPPSFRNVVAAMGFTKKQEREMPVGNDGNGRALTRKLLYMSAPQGKMLVVVRLEFGQSAKDIEDANIRFSPGAVRLVAQKKDDSGTPVPSDYYPIGTLESGWEHPTLYADKPDDFLFVRWTIGEDKPGVDLVYLVDEKLFQSNQKVASPAFIEFKRMMREELGGKELKPWAAVEIKEKDKAKFGTIHPPGVEVKLPGSEKPQQ